MSKGRGGCDTGGAEPRGGRTELARALAIPDLTERLLEVAAIVTAELAEIGVRPVVVGGLAVAYWTEARFPSYDIDFLAPSTAEVAARLEGLDFSRRGRLWVAPGGEVTLEAPGTTLAPSEEGVAVTLASGRSVVVLSLEDVLLDRLHQFRAGGHSDVYLQSVALLALPELDRERLQARAQTEGLAAALARVEKAEAGFVARGVPPESWELHELAVSLP